MKAASRIVRVFVGVLLAGLAGCAGQQSFSSAEEAKSALASALEEKDRGELRRIFGPQVKELRSSDPVQDREDLRRFALAMKTRVEVRSDGTDAATLLVGRDRWPFAVPLVRGEDGQWRFDTEAGADELMNRRIGRNELMTIQACRTLFEAQREYFAMDRGGDGVNEYADRMMSTPGKHDGLYWPSMNDDDVSPIGPVFAEAATRSDGRGHRAPFHGYHYKKLVRQGPGAPGGAMEYATPAGWTNGWAVIASPDEYGETGIMTFIVSHSGTIYEKNLGDATDSHFISCVVFDPSDGWKPTSEASAN